MLNFFQIYLFHNEVKFFPQILPAAKASPSLFLEEHGPNKTKRDEQKLNDQRGNGLENLWPRPSRKERLLIFRKKNILYPVREEKFALFIVCGV